MDRTFSGELFEWRGPAPYVWLALPEEVCEYVRVQASEASYGWGAVPVSVRIGGTDWETSLLPRDGGYVLPVKDLVRKREQLGRDGAVTVSLTVAPRRGREANGTRRAR